MIKALIIDDEREVGNFLTHLLLEKDYEVDVGYSGSDFNRLCERNTYDLAMIDVKLPDVDGLQILKEISRSMPRCKTIIMTGYSTVKVAVEAIKLGASDYIEKPFDDIDHLETIIDNLLQNKTTFIEDEIRRLARMSGIILGKNEKMKQLLTLAYKIATKNINVLIQGETGTGKDLLAHFIHLASNRNNHPYIRINCGALSETILESELFGHEKGAFTGATKERKGVFEIANKGTLFLDEVADASLATQVKLLRVIESGEYMRVGGEEVRKTNTRIVSATNIDLIEAVENKTFRQDLLFRLDVVQLKIPPLRERKEEIIPIVNHYLNKVDNRIMLRDDTIELLLAYDWPGNIRELSNVMKRALSLLNKDEHIITPDYLPDQLKTEKIPLKQEQRYSEEVDYKLYIQNWKKEMLKIWESEEIVAMDVLLEKVKELEEFTGRAYIRKVLTHTIGNQKEAAELLEINQRKLRYLLHEKGQSS